MNKRIIALSIACLMAGTALSQQAPYSYKMPQSNGTFKQPNPITAVDKSTGFLQLPAPTRKVAIASTDMVMEDVGPVPLNTAISKKTSKQVPYILAVAVTEKGPDQYEFSYYDAAKIKKMAEANPGRAKAPAASAGTQAETKRPWKMTTKDNKPILEVYFYTFIPNKDKPTDTELTFLCTGMEMFGDPNNPDTPETKKKRQLFRDVLNEATDPSADKYSVKFALDNLKK